jgi:two-component system phosphate regulon response regulator PhoB
VAHIEGLTAISGQAPVNFSAGSVRSLSQRILIVDRDPRVADTLKIKLADAGFEVTVLASVDDALALIDRKNPHLVMVDWDLPGLVTMPLLRRVQRSAGEGTTRLIALSEMAGEQHVLSGFELGIDDYVVKPYSVPELVARVRAVLRSTRSVESDPHCMQFRQLRMDTSEARVMVQQGVVKLRAIEFRLLEFLMRHPERAFHRDTLLRRVWGAQSNTHLRAVDVTVQRVRRALAPYGYQRYLQTIRGVGYRLSATEPG